MLCLVGGFFFLMGMDIENRLGIGMESPFSYLDDIIDME